MASFNYSGNNSRAETLGFTILGVQVPFTKTVREGGVNILSAGVSQTQINANDEANLLGWFPQITGNNYAAIVPIIGNIDKTFIALSRQPSYTALPNWQAILTGTTNAWNRTVTVYATNMDLIMNQARIALPTNIFDELQGAADWLLSEITRMKSIAANVTKNNPAPGYAGVYNTKNAEAMALYNELLTKAEGLSTEQVRQAAETIEVQKKAVELQTKIFEFQAGGGKVPNGEGPPLGLILGLGAAGIGAVMLMRGG